MDIRISAPTMMQMQNSYSINDVNFVAINELKNEFISSNK